MTAVKAAPIDPVEYTARLESAAAAAGFRTTHMGSTGGFPLLALTKRTPGVRPKVYLSSGIHGDEPAAPLALLSLIESGEFDTRANWFLCPLLNPVGTARGTRENAFGTDLNRDYRHLQSPEINAHVRWLQRQPNFDLTICLHEDWEAGGFYLYELNPHNRKSLASEMLDAVSKVCPIDMSPMIDGRDAFGGVIQPNPNPAEREQWPESIYLQAHHCRLNYTIETPSSRLLDIRIAALRAAVLRAINRVERVGS